MVFEVFYLEYFGLVLVLGDGDVAEEEGVEGYGDFFAVGALETGFVLAVHQVDDH